MTSSPQTVAPRALILAGPNGSGKTTFVREFLPVEGNCLSFINADLIAEGLSPFRPESMAIEASRLMVDRVRQMVAKREDSRAMARVTDCASLIKFPVFCLAGVVNAHIGSAFGSFHHIYLLLRFASNLAFPHST